MADSLTVTLSPARSAGCIVRLTRGAAGQGLARVHIEHNVFRAEVCDINGDGRPDVCLGVIKPTRYDSAPRRRVQFYTYDGRRLRPLWLGSRLGMPLEDFRIVRHAGIDRVLTLERERRRGTYAVGLWEWRSFGLSFVEYMCRGATARAARQLHGVSPPAGTAS